jgi:ppGpp synthetase/RelA/SpoT-type nucleotidyltranferase
MITVNITYASLQPKLIELERQVREIVGTFVAANNFLLSSRIKTLESIVDKIETGRFKSLSAFDDLVAFTIIIDTRSQHAEVLAYLKKTFLVQEIRGRSSLADERMFDFDATRVYARLSFSGVESPLSKILFEIQIRTLLQHAWSKITHPLVYKPLQIDVQKNRLAAELLANIEGIDRTLSTFSTVSRGVKRVDKNFSKELNTIIEMIDGLVENGVIPAELRPSNGRRFAENLRSMIDLHNHKFSDAIETIKQFYTEQGESFPRSITLNQLALVALQKASMLQKKPRRPRYYYITQEMISLFPDTRDLTPQVVD